jgi:hypothetical protein
LATGRYLRWSAACVFCLVGFGLPEAKTLDTAGAIISAVHDRGALKVVSEMAGRKPRAWNHVIAGIESGDAKWLEVAALLHEGVDAGSGEDLSMAVAHALLRAPARVLTMTPDPFRLDDICTMPDIEPPLARYRDYIRQAKAALAGVHQPELQELRDRCLAAFDAMPPS